MLRVLSARRRVGKFAEVWLATGADHGQPRQVGIDGIRASNVHDLEDGPPRPKDGALGGLRDEGLDLPVCLGL